MGGTGVTTQADGVPKTFAETGQIPNPAVVSAIIMASGATEIAISRQTRVACIVKKLLSDQHLRRQIFHACCRS
jgi:hypothetical protein